MSVAAPTRPATSHQPRRQPRVPTLVRLAGRAFHYRDLMLAASLSLAASGVLVLIGPRIVGIAIDTGLAIDDEGGVARGTVASVGIASVVLIIAAVVRGGSMFGQTYLGERISQSVAYDLRNEIYDRLQRLSFAYHDQAQIGGRHVARDTGRGGRSGSSSRWVSCAAPTYSCSSSSRRL